MTCIFELNDSALTIYRDRTPVHRSPGVAVVLDDENHFGDAALRLARIHPRQTNLQYFSRLNADPLPAPAGRARNHADLVYLHLQSIKPHIDEQGGSVLLAVPGVFTPDQLGVLLGVLQEVGIGVDGFVDTAVAALSTQATSGRAYHVDIMLQRLVVTTLDTEDGQVSKSAAQEVPECGLIRLLDGWTNVIADRFVRETRFDPLHAAATEQQLFNQVYDWVDDGAAAGDLAVEIVHAGHNRRVELGRAVLEDKAEQRFRQIADAIPRAAQVFVSARSARLPGLARALEQLQATVVELADDAVPDGCLRNLSDIVPDGNELRLVTRLSAAGQAAQPHAQAAPTRTAPTHPPATHAVVDGVARRLAAVELPVRRNGEHWLLETDASVQLNGEPATGGATLQPGDRVKSDEHEYLIIHVAD